jgi:hypothetical protein
MTTVGLSVNTVSLVRVCGARALALLGGGLFSVHCAMLSSSHSCAANFYDCSPRTSIALEVPGGSWPVGDYVLTVGNETCALSVTSAAPSTGIVGDCDASESMSFALEPTQECAASCDGAACGGSVCAPTGGPNKLVLTVDGLMTGLSLMLTKDNGALVSETVKTEQMTVEPNGAGCGSCVMASATIVVGED